MVKEYLDSTGIEYKENTTQLILKACPYCDYKKNLFGHFYFSKENDTFFCHHCKCRGNLFKFKLDRGDIVKKATEKIYKRPAENPYYTSDTDKFYGWYHDNRGINNETLRNYKVGMLKESGNLYAVYQYFNENGYLVDRKYKKLHGESGKKMWTEKNAEKIYYGIDKVDLSAKMLFVVEGEDDCHALTQMGFVNVVSVPNGAGNYTVAMDKINRNMTVLVLLFDNDDAGQEGARKFAEKAGLGKCKNVILPFKDARECLQKGVESKEIWKAVNEAKMFKHSEICKFSDLSDEILNIKEECGTQIEIKEFNRIVGGLREGELSVLTGHTGHGKSTCAYNMAHWGMQAGMSVMIMSFENKVKKVAYKMIEIRTGESIKKFDKDAGHTVYVKDVGWIRDKLDSLGDEDCYILNTRQKDFGYYDVDKMEQIIEYAEKFNNVKLFIIDHLHYFLKTKTPGREVHEIDESVRRIKQWTNKYNVHIVLIAHPTKTEDSRTGQLSILGLNCIKGSSSISQESDNFWVVSRPDNSDLKESKFSIIKNREHGNFGEVYFSVCENNNTFMEKSSFGG